MAADENLFVNKSLSPCTTEFAFVRCTFEDYSSEVVFIDTPAFPDPYEGKISLLEEQNAGNQIREWVKKA